VRLFQRFSISYSRYLRLNTAFVPVFPCNSVGKYHAVGRCICEIVPVIQHFIQLTFDTRPCICGPSSRVIVLVSTMQQRGAFARLFQHFIQSTFKTQQHTQKPSSHAVVLTSTIQQSVMSSLSSLSLKWPLFRCPVHQAR
jgi:membrane-associated HD superfamily phosphohydrolase